MTNLVLSGINYLPLFRIVLTDGEFSEFVSLNNQLGQMFPRLIMDSDSNENAILSLLGNVDTLAEFLYSFAEAQIIASAQIIADTMPEVMSNMDSTVEAYFRLFVALFLLFKYEYPKS